MEGRPSSFRENSDEAGTGRRRINILFDYHTPEGKPITAVGNVRDNQRPRQLENLRETFLAMLGHELQTPLSIIKGYTQHPSSNRR
jgi:signal transduction histidine kinase